MLNRRNFLRTVGLSGGAYGLMATIGAPLARAMPTGSVDSGRYFVSINFRGGWDTLLGLDPRDPALFPDSTKGIHGIQPGYDLLPSNYSRVPLQGPGSQITIGPTMEPMAPSLRSIISGTKGMSRKLQSGFNRASTSSRSFS